MIHLKVYGALCETQEFTVSGIEAEHSDFGEKYDHSPEDAEPYACGDMRFTGKPSTPGVLAKYNITQEQYDAVVENLDALSFGSCGRCV